MGVKPIFVVAFLCAGVLAWLSSAACAQDEPVLGPFIGHVDSETAVLWARVPGGGTCALRLIPEKGRPLIQVARPSEATDWTARWTFTNLQPDSIYRYELLRNGVVVARGDDQRFTTPPTPHAVSSVRIAFATCAYEDESTRAVWRRIKQSDITALVLGGDTPYIDSTDLAVQNRRYREFASVPEMMELMRSIPNWSTWDDHDFGKNDSDGTLPGKENARQAFLNYRAQVSYGLNDEGIFTKFRHGPVEVFMIDARWFSWTGPSFADPSKKTLLGEAQWRWLCEGLRASDAPFKLLITGIIWHDKQNKEKDDWGTYPHELDALFNFIREEKIEGVVLVGGDVHCSRIYRHTPSVSVGYPIYELVSSPAHSRTIPALNIKHPNVVRAAVVPNTFLLIEVDRSENGDVATLRAKFLDSKGERLFDDLELKASELKLRVEEVSG